VVLVLDDHHLIANDEFHQAVDFLLEHLPDDLHLAIATRGEPPLALGRLRGAGTSSKSAWADLRFTRRGGSTPPRPAWHTS
jgi:LuxR family transcriptional regulator, maltose regulon positive regulatory protein